MISVTSSASRDGPRARCAWLWAPPPDGAVAGRASRSPTDVAAKPRPTDAMDLVRIGRLQRPHGLRGELVLDGVSLTPEELQAVETFTWRGRDGSRRPQVLESVRGPAGRLLVRFQGVEDRDQAAVL